jgi:predicted O-linked N-acetylglucosamine transferase (SPINDLY family)
MWRGLSILWISLCLVFVTNANDLNKILDQADQFYEQGSFESALHSYETALELSPQDLYSIQGAAIASQSLKLYFQSGQYYEFAGKRSQIPDFYLNAGMAYKEGGFLDQSIRVYQICLKLNSKYHQCHIKLAEIYNVLNEVHLVQHHLLSAIELNPREAAMPYQYLGDVYNNIKQFQRAIQAYQKSLQLLSPQGPMTKQRVQLLISLGDVYSNIKQPITALEFYQQGYDLLQDIKSSQEKNPHHPPFSFAASSAFLTSELNAQIGILFSQLPMALWKNYENHVHQIIRTTKDLLLHQQTNPQPSVLSPYRSLFLPVSPHFIASVSKSWVQAYAREVTPLSVREIQSTEVDPRSPDLISDPSPQPSRDSSPCPHLLRIGYLSRRFEDYPGTQMMLRVFQFHNRSRCQLSAYALGPDDSSLYRELVRQYSDQFRDLSLASLEQSSSVIQQDELDILVDYDGIHDFNSLKLLMRLARSQHNETTATAAGAAERLRRKKRIHVTWLGFAGTTGMTPRDGITYLLADKIIAPPDLLQISSPAAFTPGPLSKKVEVAPSSFAFTEKLVYLPGSYQPQDEFQGRADISSSSFASPEFPLSLQWFQNRTNQRRQILSSYVGGEGDVWGRSEEEKESLLNSFWFICFNRLEKVSPDVFEDWILILTRSPHAILILMAESHEVQLQLQVLSLCHVLIFSFSSSLLFLLTSLAIEEFPFLWSTLFKISFSSTHASLFLSPHSLTL